MIIIGYRRCHFLNMEEFFHNMKKFSVKKFHKTNKIPKKYFHYYSAMNFYFDLAVKDEMHVDQQKTGPYGLCEQ